MERISLEKAALEVCVQSAKPPLIFQLPPEQGRQALEKAQDMPVFLYPAEVFVCEINTDDGKIKVFVVKPENLRNPADVIFYLHGAGWVFGSFHTHEKLVRELAARTGCLLIFPEYSRSPEARYPTAIRQCYQILCRLPEFVEAAGYQMRADTLTVAGDSVGGNMAIAMSVLSKENHGPFIQKQLLYYPVTNACFSTSSYIEFARGYYLYRAGMQWFWDQYTLSQRDRNAITASPLRANLEQLKGLPETMLLNGEADVLRDEGEQFARKLRSAGVPVTAIRFQAIIHDFVMLNALDQTKACRAAMDVSTEWIVRRNLQR